MIDLGDRTILDDGTVLCKIQAIMEMLYSDRSIETVLSEPSEDVYLHNDSDRMLDTNLGMIETAKEGIYESVAWSSHWLTPEPYASMDIRALCLDRCKTQEERDRSLIELDLFHERNMIPALRHLVYLVDDWRARGIVWGVGRGSSVGSFVLYLIGINRINPMQWGLAIEEFLK